MPDPLHKPVTTPHFFARFLRKKRLRARFKSLHQEITALLQYNRDLLPEDLSNRLQATLSDLQQCAKRKDYEQAEAVQLSANGLLSEASEAVPKRPHPALFEFIETIFVAFGVAFAFRAYFFQPFKIPTGSMQPTLFGLHSIASGEAGFADRYEPFSTLKWLVTGRRYVDATAPRTGSILLYEDRQRAPGCVILSLAGKEFKLPTDVLDRRELPILQRLRIMPDNPATTIHERGQGRVQKGQRVWSGYVISGDQVFVNRFLWNWRLPKRDEVSVFATSQLSLHTSEESRNAACAAAPDSAYVQTIPFYGFNFYFQSCAIPGLPPAQHYIKRLVGMPGETISIRPPDLLANGEVLSGYPGIDRERTQQKSPSGPAYTGYRNTADTGQPNPAADAYLRTANDAITLDGQSYLHMGDNTLNSYDGRYWGSVPRAQMLGPAACVYWPLSVRWGSIPKE